MTYIDIRDLGTLYFHSSTNCSAYLQGGSDLLMYVSDSNGNSSVDLLAPSSGGLSFNSSNLSGGFTFFPFSGSALYVKAYGSSNSFYSGKFAKFGASESTKFKNAVFLITDNSSSATSVSNNFTTYYAGGNDVPTTDIVGSTNGWNSSSTSKLSASNMRIGFLTMNYTDSSTTKMTLIYLNSSTGTWASSSITSDYTYKYFKFECTNCTLNRIA